MKSKFRFKLDLQLFAEDNDEKQKEKDRLIKENETFKALNDEWQKKFDDQKKDYENKIKTINENHNQQIRALVSGRSENLNEETKKLQEKKELSFEEQLLKDTRKNLGLKEEN